LLTVQNNNDSDFPQQRNICVGQLYCIHFWAGLLLLIEGGSLFVQRNGLHAPVVGCGIDPAGRKYWGNCCSM
jgi:hypothetical protein